MSTLKSCMLKAGKSLNKNDVKLMTDARKQYINEGLSEAQANSQAIEDLVRDTSDKVAAYETEIEAKGGFTDSRAYNLDEEIANAKGIFELEGVESKVDKVIKKVRPGAKVVIKPKVSAELITPKGPKGPIPPKGGGPIPPKDLGLSSVMVESTSDKFIRIIQDKFKPLKSTQERVSELGGKLSDEENAYVSEELFHGKTEEDLRKLENEHIKPLAVALSGNSITIEELGLFVTAKHAKERNAYIASINEKFPDGGSGMTNAEADTILAKFESEGRFKKIDRVAEKIYAMTKKRIDVMKNSGLISDTEAESLQSSYENYVPLKGFAEDEINSEGSKIPRIGKGFALRGRENMQSLGRRSMAENPAIQVVQDLTETIIRARRNEVGNDFLKLVQNNPDSEYWQVFTDSKPDVKRTLNKATGKVESVKVPMVMVADKYFTTKVDGETHYIKLKDERLLAAMKNLGVESSNGFIRTLGTVNRYLSTINTSWNPEFVISNMARDVQTAVFNVLAEQELPTGKIKGANIAKNMVLDWRAARKGIALNLAGKDQTTGKVGDYQKLYNQFREDGAKTGFFDMKGLDTQIKDINSMLDIASGSAKGRVINATKKILDFVENINQSVENAVRLTAYKHALDAGVSRKKAASLAKNLTVNFNRKGEIGTTLNSLYMFSNASIQGTAQFLRSLKGYRDVDGNYKFTGSQKVAAGLVGGAYLIATMNRAFSDDDDDGVNLWDKVPSYVKERNVVIMKSIFGGEQGKFWTLPLAYGYNIFSVMGTVFEGLNAGNKNKSEAVSDITGAMLGSFSPIGAQGSESLTKGVIKTITPSILQPATQIAINENFYGGQVYTENNRLGTKLPESSLAKASTKEHFKVISEWLNSATGGSYYTSGKIDINPGKIQHFFDFFTGAAGAFASRTAGFAEKKLKGEDTEAREIPFYRKISGEVRADHPDTNLFYERANLVQQIHDEFSSLKGDEKKQYREDNLGVLRMLTRAKLTKTRLKSLREDIKTIEGKKNLSSGAKKLKLKIFRKEQKNAVDKFNKLYNALE